MAAARRSNPSVSVPRPADAPGGRRLFAFVFVVAAVGLSLLLCFVCFGRSSVSPSAANTESLSEGEGFDLGDAEEPFVEGYRVRKQLRRVPDCYTQGLFFRAEDQLVESCGMYQESSLRLVNILKTPKNLGGRLVDLSISTDISLPNFIFAEGCDPVETEQNYNILVQLSWMEKQAYVWDEELKFIGTWQIQPQILTQGWGFSANPNTKGTAFMTDGSSSIFLYKLPEISRKDWEARKRVDALKDGKPSLTSGFTLIRKIEVIDPDRSNKNVEHLNELAFWPGGCAGGTLISNIYMTHEIVQVCISSGHVLKRWDFARLEKIARENAQKYWSKTLQADECLNGIAIPPSELASSSTHSYPRRLFLTGKRWPLLFEIELD